MMRISIRKTALFILMCYTLLIYLSYINQTLNSLHSLCLYLTFGMSLLIALINRRLDLNRYCFWYACFTLCCLISTTYTPKTHGVSEGIFSLFVIIGLVFSFSIILTDGLQIEKFLKCLVLGSVGLTLYLILTGRMDASLDAAGRFGGILTGNANIFASIYMFAAFSSVYFIFKHDTKRLKIMYCLALLLQLYSLVMSGGRKFFLLPLLLILLILLQNQNSIGDKGWIKRILLGLIIGIGVLWAVYNVPFLYEHIGYRIDDYVSHILKGTAMIDTGTVKRSLMVERAIELWKEKPIFGQGFDAFSEIGGFQAYSHNNYTELLCNHGIVGFVVYYSFYGILLFILLKIKTDDKMMIFFRCLMICMLVFEFMAVNYNANLSQIFIFLAWNYSNAYKWKNPIDA